MTIDILDPKRSQGATPRAIRLRDDFWTIVTGENGPSSPPTLRAGGEVLLLRFPLSVDERNRDIASLRLLHEARAVPLSDAESIYVAMELQLLRSVLGEDFGTLPEAVWGLLRDTVSEISGLTVAPSPEQLLAARAIRDCLFEGAVRNIFLKSKALELVASFFGQVRLLNGACRMALLPSREVEPFLRARNILGSELETPPPLGTLAAQVGVSETRLKRGFKRLFGMAPYEWLREKRLAVAHELLLRREASVSEAAYRVGYTNVSHFIAAFIRRYNTRPGELLRLARRIAPTP